MENKITVLMVQPGKVPFVKTVDSTLEGLQAEVGGDIEVAYPFEDNVGLIMNEEGKLNGLEFNRSLRDENGTVYDVIAGPFMVVGLSDSDFCSLTPEQIRTYTEVYRHPEAFIRSEGKLLVIPY